MCTSFRTSKVQHGVVENLLYECFTVQEEEFLTGEIADKIHVTRRNRGVPGVEIFFHLRKAEGDWCEDGGFFTIERDCRSGRGHS